MYTILGASTQRRVRLQVTGVTVNVMCGCQ